MAAESCAQRWSPYSEYHPTSNVGAVELQRGREGGVSGAGDAGSNAAFAASPGLDSSHSGSAWVLKAVLSAGNPIPKSTPHPMWEPSSFSEAAKAECQAPEMPQPRRGSTAPTVDLHGC